MSPRTLPAAVLMPEYEALLRDGAELPLVISGESMLPFLRCSGEKLRFTAVPTALMSCIACSAPRRVPTGFSAMRRPAWRDRCPRSVFSRM